MELRLRPPPGSRKHELAALDVGGRKQKARAASVDLERGNPAVKAGDDFYRHVNGRWLASYELEADEKFYGAFVKLKCRAEDQLKAIIEDLARGGPRPGGIEQKLADYYKSYMDVKALEAKRLEPLEHDLDQIAAIKIQKELIKAFGRAEQMETSSPIVFPVSRRISADVAQDPHSPGEFRVNGVVRNVDAW